MPNPDRVPRLLKKLDACPIAKHAAIRTLYLNSRKVDKLFEDMFRGIYEIIDATTATEDAALEAAGEVGVSSGITRFFINLKVNLASRIRRGEKRESIIRSEITGLWRMALCELVLEDRGLVGHQAEDVQKPFLMLTDALRPVPPEVKSESLADFLESATADTIMNRLEIDKNSHQGAAQFVYAAGNPNPIAAVLLVPPNPDYGVDGTSDACYPGGPAWSRILFGAPSPWEGVTFIDPYYLIDVHSAANHSA